MHIFPLFMTDHPCIHVVALSLSALLVIKSSPHTRKRETKEEKSRGGQFAGVFFDDDSARKSIARTTNKNTQAQRREKEKENKPLVRK